MLGKLKEMAGSASLDSWMKNLEPLVSEQLSKAQALGAEVIRDDLRYLTQVTEPAYLAVVAASHGATKLIPSFKERFVQLMLRLRDELVIVEDSTVRLVEDSKARLPKILSESLKR